jgi:membrane associated rhomboid family serine protease
MIPLRTTEPPRSTALVTAALIVVNVAVFLYEFFLPAPRLHQFLHQWGMVPDRLEVVTLLTAMFLHGSWLHLISNVWFLWIYGRSIEDLFGAGRFLLFYLLTGLAAAGVHLAFHRYSPIPTIGASGAIAGVMGAFLVKMPRARIVTLVPILIFFTTMEVPAALLLLYWFAMQFLYGVGSLAAAGSNQGIAWFAHVGGFLAGALLAWRMKSRPRLLFEVRSEQHHG